MRPELVDTTRSRCWPASLASPSSLPMTDPRADRAHRGG